MTKISIRTYISILFAGGAPYVAIPLDLNRFYKELSKTGLKIDVDLCRSDVGAFMESTYHDDSVFCSVLLNGDEYVYPAKLNKAKFGRSVVSILDDELVEIAREYVATMDIQLGIMEAIVDHLIDKRLKYSQYLEETAPYQDLAIKHVVELKREINHE